MSKLEEYFDSTAAILQARYEKSHAINHNLSKGECRETLIENFLSEMYPDRYCFGDGEIIDSSGNVSKQSDIVIYDDRLPVLEYEGSKHFFSEGVLAHIEVKSNLSGEFENALNNVESVKNLHQNNDNTLAMGNQSNGIFSCIFAFEGPEWTKFSEKTRDYYYTNISGEEYKKSVPMVDTVCVLDEYIFVRGNGSNYAMSTNNPLLQFFIVLTNAINSNLISRPDLRQYTDDPSHFMKVGDTRVDF